MQIETAMGFVEIIDEPTYSFGSADNLRKYTFFKNLARQHYPNSTHGILLNGKPLVILGAEGGASGVHQNSAAYVYGDLYIAVGDSVACMRLDPFQFKWATQTDTSTCFGIHYQPEWQALISHGELEIVRLSNDGRILWSSSGADIFSEGFSLFPDYSKSKRDRKDFYTNLAWEN